MKTMPEMYTNLADWWPLISAPEDYAEEAAFFRQVFTENAAGPLRTMLELGCGGGNNASYLKRDYEMTLVDISAGMLAVSQRLNPECAHVQGDMCSVRLGHLFDAVLVHDAIMYMTSETDLLAAMQTAAAHCKPGGVALFCPDETCEIFAPFTDHGGSDAPDGRGIRYLEWSHDPDPSDSTYEVDYAYILHNPGQPAMVVQDHHVLGLFPRAAWLRLMQEAGFKPALVRDLYDRDLFVGVRA